MLFKTLQPRWDVVVQPMLSKGSYEINKSGWIMILRIKVAESWYYVCEALHSAREKQFDCCYYLTTEFWVVLTRAITHSEAWTFSYVCVYCDQCHWNPQVYSRSDAVWFLAVLHFNNPQECSMFVESSIFIQILQTQIPFLVCISHICWWLAKSIVWNPAIILYSVKIDPFLWQPLRGRCVPLKRVACSLVTISVTNASIRVCVRVCVCMCMCVCVWTWKFCKYLSTNDLVSTKFVCDVFSSMFM